MKKRRANAVAVMALAWGVAWAAMGAALKIGALAAGSAPLPVLIASASKYGTYGIVVGLWFGLIVAAMSRLWTRKSLFVASCAVLVGSVAFAVGVGDGNSGAAGLAFALFGAACGLVSLGLAARQPNRELLLARFGHASISALDAAEPVHQSAQSAIPRSGTQSR